MRTLALALLAALAPVAVLADSFTVTLNQAVRMTLPSPAQDVVVGNPLIADVQVADRRHLVIVGKSFGVTNLIVTAANGRTMVNREIVVPMNQTGRVTIIGGGKVTSLACAPYCQTPEEAKASFDADIAQAQRGSVAPTASQSLPTSDLSQIRASPTLP